MHTGSRILSALVVLLSTATAFALDNSVLRMATTTSTDNSGLLAYLLPEFEARSDYRVHVIAVGTGKALRMARDGDVDLVLVHAPQAEQQFVSAGFGLRRQPVMHNDFVLVGPTEDPAGIEKAPDSRTAMRAIAQRQSLFLSRGDDSGTHKKERRLWPEAGVEPAQAWYREAGQGMGRVLQMAGEMQAYTLADRGTWLALRERLPLRLLYDGDPALHNPYGVIGVNPARHPDTHHQGAQALIRFLISSEGQALIDAFRVNGERLFTANTPAIGMSTSTGSR